MSSETEPEEGEFFKGLVFAPQGHGKTHLAGTLALDERTTPCMLLNFEAGFQTLRGLPGKNELWHPRRIKSWGDYEDAFEELEDNKLGIKSVGVDSISETQIFALMNILDEEAGRRRENQRDMLQMQDYGKAMIQLRRFVRSFRDLDMHVLFLASAKDVQDPREGMIKKPALSGQLADDIPGMMDVVGYLAIMSDEEGDPVRSLILHGEPKVRTKVRAPWGVDIPEEIIDPSVTKILDTLSY
jgi:hypothetical protein